MIARDRKALLVGGSVVVTAILLLRVLPWGVRRVLTTERDLRERTALLARTRADLAEAVSLRDSAATVGQALVRLAPKLLSGNTAAEAMADLAGRLNLGASRSQAKLARVDQMPDSAAAGRLRRVRVRATLESDVRGVTGVLRAVEFNEAALSVSEMRIVATNPAAADQASEVLLLEVTVTGWFLERGDRGRGKGEG
jgi:type II secretion system (T2SS) protein M